MVTKILLLQTNHGQNVLSTAFSDSHNSGNAVEHNYYRFDGYDTKRFKASCLDSYIARKYLLLY